MTTTIKILTTILIMLIILTPAYSQIRTPDFKIHDRGNLWDTMRDDGTIGAPNPMNSYEFYPSMDWPGGPHKLHSKADQRSYMVAAGMWVGWKTAAGAVEFSERGPLSGVRNEGQFITFEEIENFSEDLETYDVNQPEEMIIAEWETPEGMHVKRSSKVWSYPDFKNCIMIDYEVTNQTGESISDVYVGFPYLIRPSYQDIVVHNGWGDDVHSSDEIVRYDTARAMLYAYDADPAFSGLNSDIGNYWQDFMELRTTGYAGFALLNADPADGNAPQPANVFWAHLIGNSTRFTLFSTTKSNLYDILRGADKSLQAGPEDRLSPIMLMACGPYSLAPNETVRFSIVEAVDGLPLEDVRDLELNEFTAVQERLPEGLALLETVIDNAQALHNADYKLQAVPPPSPVLEIVPNPSQGSITISWDDYETDYTDPLTGVNDLVRYVIYRSEYGFIGPYEIIKSRIRPGNNTDRTRYYNEERSRWEFEDLDILLGAGYFYAVTAVDADGNESWFTNRNETAVKAASLPDSTTLNISVFPNPFREVSGFPLNEDANSIVWTNLPETCTIRIYTSNGEMVRKMEHNNPNSGEEVWDQLTSARQRTAPGIYFWTVESSVGTAKGTLILIK